MLNKINQQASMGPLKWILLSAAVFASAGAKASCQAETNSGETTFALDLSQSKVQLVSKKDVSPIQVSSCSGPESKYLQLAIENLFYDTDIRASDYLVGQKFAKSCEIKSEIPLTTLQPMQEEQGRIERQNFNRQCLAVLVTEQSGRRIEFNPAQKFCKGTAMTPGQDSVLLEGMFCAVKTNPLQTYSIKMVVKPECMRPETLISQKIFSKDIETRLLVRETSDDSGRAAMTNVVGLRNIRFSILPDRSLLPTASGDDDSGLEYVSVLATNMHQGPISIRKMGLNRAQVDVKYMAEHFSEQICNGVKGCSRVTDFNAPVVAKVQMNMIQGTKKVALQEWYAPFRLPPQWAGMVTPLFNIGLGKPVSQVLIDQAFKAGDRIEVVSEFFEPRSMLEVLKYDNGFSDGVFDMDFSPEPTQNGASLPTLPTLAAPALKAKLPELPRVHLGSTPLDWNMFNLKNSGEWTHYYDRVCDANNSQCEKTKGADRAFTKLVTTFELGEILPTGEFSLKEIQSVKTSKTFGSYQKSLTQLPYLNCDLPMPVQTKN